MSRMCIRNTFACLSLALGIHFVILNAPTLQAESLFMPNTQGMHPRANAPRMLYSPPRSQRIGDLVTIRIQEQSQRQNQSTLDVSKTSEIDETTSSVFNGAVTDVLSRFGSGAARVANFLRLPSLGGIDNSTETSSQANTIQNQNLTDVVTCQVVQILPNGNLMVQGRKTLAYAKEKTDVYLTGIVNPYFLNSQNEISSSQVANMQLMVAGKGVVSRSQNDGLLTKIMSFIQ